VVAEADTLSSDSLAVRSDVASTTDLPNRCSSSLRSSSLVRSSRRAIFPLTHAGEVVREILIELLRVRLRDTDMPGVEWLDWVGLSRPASVHSRDITAA
jgi:hypothetical protein